MAGIDLTTANTMLQAALEAQAAVFKAQQLGQGDQNLVRAKLAEISAEIRYWNTEVQRLDAASNPGTASRARRLIVHG